VKVAIQKAEVSSEEVITVLDCSADRSSGVDRQTAPAKIDRLWIFRHSGRVGEPRGNRRLPWTGPPEDGGRAEASSHDDSSNYDEQKDCLLQELALEPRLHMVENPRSLTKRHCQPRHQRHRSARDSIREPTRPDKTQQPLPEQVEVLRGMMDSTVPRWRLKYASKGTKMLAGKWAM
jgi:hypothetical protein